MADFSVLAADSYIDQQNPFARNQGFNCGPSLPAPEHCSWSPHQVMIDVYVT
jgi:hypothetical protein